MEKVMMNKEVKSHLGTCIGFIVNEQELFGKVVKVNKSSFKVLFTKEVSKKSGKIVNERTVNLEVSYRLWKEVNGKSYYVPTISGGRKIYGIIEL